MLERNLMKVPDGKDFGDANEHKRWIVHDEDEAQYMWMCVGSVK